MHELSLAQNLMASILNILKQYDSVTKVIRIKICIGEASGVDVNFLDHSLKEHVLKNTVCENAQIEYEKLPVKIKCKSCGKIYSEITANICTVCGEDGFEVISGNEFYVKEIELE